jgi:hypothetical protein
MAIQRFSTACGRESDYDRLLDLVFTLEILFGKGDGDSIKHRILARLINLISSNKEIVRRALRGFIDTMPCLGHYGVMKKLGL